MLAHALGLSPKPVTKRNDKKKGKKRKEKASLFYFRNRVESMIRKGSYREGYRI